MTEKESEAMFSSRQHILNAIERNCAWYRAGQMLSPPWWATLTERVDNALSESDELKLQEELARIAAICICKIESIHMKRRGW